MSSDVTEVIENMLYNRRNFVELNGQRNRWRNQKKMVFYREVCYPMYSNSYTNVQLVHRNTWSLIFPDDLCIATHSVLNEKTDSTLSDALETLPNAMLETTYVPTQKRHRNAYFMSETEKPTESWTSRGATRNPTPTYLRVITVRIAVNTT